MADHVVIIDGTTLNVEQLFAVALGEAKAKITDDPVIRKNVEQSHIKMQEAVNTGHIIYGVTTGFGGMADHHVAAQQSEQLQNTLVWIHKTGAGNNLPIRDVRAAMLLRANSHLRGASGIRMMFAERLVEFLNHDVTPCVPELGSIGASGDLVPLSYIAGAVIGHDADYEVIVNGKQIPARVALEQLGMKPVRFLPKEALAMMNGTSVMCGIAGNCLKEAEDLLSLTLHVHSLMLQGLQGSNLYFRPYIHELKPHPGQKWAAENVLRLIDGSALIRNAECANEKNPKAGLVQDRYSLRCLPQYLGPIIEDIWNIKQQLQIEMNSANDNPLINPVTGEIYYGGNFLGEHVGVPMDHLRYDISLIAKHVDVQIAQLVEPLFSNGLNACLIGNAEKPTNMGMKGLQISGNSILPLIQFYGNSIADRYPTHAEQFNQNINSQGFDSANLARQQIDLFRRYLSIALLFAVQCVDLRAHLSHGTYDASKYLSPETKRVYQAVRDITQTPANDKKPWLWNNEDKKIDIEIRRLNDDLCKYDSVLKAASKLPLHHN